MDQAKGRIMNPIPIRRNNAKQNPTLWRRDIILLTFYLGGLFFIFLGDRSLHVPDEGRYAEIAREMWSSQDYLTPHLNHLTYFEKPPLFYWLEVVAIKLGGLNIFSLRAINAVFALMGCLFTYHFATRLYDRKTALFAACILGTSPLYFGMAHMINLDMSMAIFLSVSLYAFLLALQHPLGPQRRAWIWVTFTSAAFATLTKGLIGIVFPGIIIGMWIIVMHEWRLLSRLYLPSGILLFLLITAPWHILIHLKSPEFFNFYFIQQHFLRYATKAIGHYQPAWFFIPILILGFFPWIVFLPQTFYALSNAWLKRHTYQNEIFLLLWIILIFAFFSLSHSKLIPYILPIFPPLAILTTRCLVLTGAKKTPLALTIGFYCLPFLTLLMILFLYFSTDFSLAPDPQQAKFFLYGAFSILLIGNCSALLLHRAQLFKAMGVTVFSMSLFLITLLPAIPYLDENTIYPIAKTVQPHLKPQDEIISFKQYYQDLPFYLERRISVVDWRNELSFGMDLEPTAREWMIDEETFWKKWQGDQRIFVIMRSKQYRHLVTLYPHKSFHIIAQTKKNIMVSNKMFYTNPPAS